MKYTYKLILFWPINYLKENNWEQNYPQIFLVRIIGSLKMFKQENWLKDNTAKLLFYICFNEVNTYFSI